MREAVGLVVVLGDDLRIPDARGQRNRPGNATVGNIEHPFRRRPRMAAQSDFSDLDTEAFRIPPRAWGLAFLGIALAGLVLWAVPGPAYVGSFAVKSGRVFPQAPFVLATLTLLVGGGLAVWLGRVPRHWITGWSAATGFIAAVVLVAMPLVLTHPYESSDVGYWWRECLISSVLCFCFFWLVQIPVGLMATLLPAPSRTRIAHTPVLQDDRPLWLREVTSALATIANGGTPALTSAESQLVGELAFTLAAGAGPPALIQHAARLRSILARTDASIDVREAIADELRRASVAVVDDVYRVG